jgi:hypothetical protein
MCAAFLKVIITEMKKKTENRELSIKGYKVEYM